MAAPHGVGRRPLPLLAAVAFALFTTPFSARPLEAQDLPNLHQHFLRGDVNEDGAVQISDVLTILSYLFSGGTAHCLDAADTNDDEEVDAADAITLLGHLFLAAGPLPAPSLTCDADPTDTVALPCDQYLPCAGDTTVGVAGHLLRRLGYGPTPERIDHVLSIGHVAYIDEQLHPELDDELDNTVLQDQLAALNPSSSSFQLIRWQMVHALYSRNQLREAQVDFWENHFNTDLSKQSELLRGLGGMNPIYTPQEAASESTSWEWEENEYFRANAFGSFLDLLVASATSKNMISYLDGYLNTEASPNENYARELLELHTMGVDNGYTQEDIEEVARCFTGWTLRKHAPGTENDPLAPGVALTDPTGVWALHFARVDHDYDEKVIFAGTSYELVIPAQTPLSDAGLDDGFILLEHLAGLPQTAEFVSTKLIQKYVADEPPLDLVAACLGTWLATNGDLLAVMNTILTSDHFLARENRWNKIETPFENLASAARAIGAETNGVPIIAGIGSPQYGLIGLDHQLFFYETPEGQSERGVDWLGATSLLNRILYAQELTQSTGNPSTSLLIDMQNAGIDLADAEAVADFWLTQLFQTGYDWTERTVALDYLSSDEDGVPTPLDPTQTLLYRERIRAFVGFLLSSPLANQQ
ncbi:MAG: DUF1800 family protein [Planctomycetota bacterium]